jgi:hypothetical protein
MDNLKGALDPDQKGIVSIPEADAANLASVTTQNSMSIKGSLDSVSAYQVIQQQSALPVTGTVTTQGGTLVVMFSGTGNVASVSPSYIYILGVLIYIDGNYVGQATIWVVDTNAKTLSTTLVVEGIPSGQHTVTIINFKDTVVNLNYNTWNLVMLEI